MNTGLLSGHARRLLNSLLPGGKAPHSWKRQELRSAGLAADCQAGRAPTCRASVPSNPGYPDTHWAEEWNQVHQSSLLASLLKAPPVNAQSCFKHAASGSPWIIVLAGRRPVASRPLRASPPAPLF